MRGVCKGRGVTDRGKGKGKKRGGGRGEEERQREENLGEVGGINMGGEFICYMYLSLSVLRLGRKLGRGVGKGNATRERLKGESLG